MWNNICRGGSCYNMQGRTHVTSPVVQALRGFAPTHSMKTDLYKAQFLRCCSSICFTVNETIKDDSRKVWACTAMCEGDSILWGFTGIRTCDNGNPTQYVLSAGRRPAELSEPERGGEIAVWKQFDQLHAWNMSRPPRISNHQWTRLWTIQFLVLEHPLVYVVKSAVAYGLTSYICKKISYGFGWYHNKTGIYNAHECTNHICQPPARSACWQSSAKFERWRWPGRLHLREGSQRAALELNTSIAQLKLCPFSPAAFFLLAWCRGPVVFSTMSQCSALPMGMMMGSGYWNC